MTTTTTTTMTTMAADPELSPSQLDCSRQVLRLQQRREALYAQWKRAFDEYKNEVGESAEKKYQQIDVQVVSDVAYQFRDISEEVNALVSFLESDCDSRETADIVRRIQSAEKIILHQTAALQVLIRNWSLVECGASAEQMSYESYEHARRIGTRKLEQAVHEKNSAVEEIRDVVDDAEESGAAER